MRVADKADTHGAPRFGQWQFVLPNPAKEAEVDVQYVAAIKTIKKVLPICLDREAEAAVEKGGSFGEPTLR